MTLSESVNRLVALSELYPAQFMLVFMVVVSFVIALLVAYMVYTIHRYQVKYDILNAVFDVLSQALKKSKEARETKPPKAPQEKKAELGEFGNVLNKTIESTTINFERIQGAFKFIKDNLEAIESVHLFQSLRAKNDMVRVELEWRAIHASRENEDEISPAYLMLLTADTVSECEFAIKVILEVYRTKPMLCFGKQRELPTNGSKENNVLLQAMARFGPEDLAVADLLLEAIRIAVIPNTQIVGDNVLHSTFSAPKASVIQVIQLSLSITTKKQIFLEWLQLYYPY
jgi:hypothetical protein